MNLKDNSSLYKTEAQIVYYGILYLNQVSTSANIHTRSILLLTHHRNINQTIKNDDGEFHHVVLQSAWIFFLKKSSKYNYLSYQEMFTIYIQDQIDVLRKILFLSEINH